MSFPLYLSSLEDWLKFCSQLQRERQAQYLSSLISLQTDWRGSKPMDMSLDSILDHQNWPRYWHRFSYRQNPSYRMYPSTRSGKPKYICFLPLKDHYCEFLSFKYGLEGCSMPNGTCQSFNWNAQWVSHSNQNHLLLFWQYRSLNNSKYHAAMSNK